MSASDILCPGCGASNSPDAITCFACDRPLGELRNGATPVASAVPTPTVPPSASEAAPSPALPATPQQEVAASSQPPATSASPPPHALPIAERRKRPLGAWLIAGLIVIVLLGIGTLLIHPFSPAGKPAGQSAAPSAGKDQLAIGINESSTDQVLDPIKQAGADDLQVESLLYSGLTTVNGRNQLMPDLAQSWSAQPDPNGADLNWTFHLRPSLKFSNGTPLTSSDVAYSIDRVFSAPDSEFAYLAPYFKDAAGRLKGNPQTLVGDSLLTPDPSTLIIKARGQGAFLPAMTSTYCFKVVNRALIEKYGKDFTKHLDEGGTSGPYKLDAPSSSSGLSLAPNPSYYSGNGQFKKISVQLYTDVNKERADFKAGRLSIMQSPDFDALTQAEQGTRLVENVSGINYLGLNYLTKPFDNTKIRQAFALGLDKMAVMDGAFHAGSLATNHIIPEGQPGFNQTLTGPAGVGSPKGDLGEARLLLQQGMQEEGIQSIKQFPTVTLTFSSGNVVSIHDEMSLMQKQWNSSLGLDVKLADIDGKVLADKIRGSANNPQGLQMWSTGWIVDYPDPQNWTTLQFSKGSAWNVANYGQNNGPDAAAQQQVQATLLKADAIQDPQQRLKAYQDAEQQLVNDVAWLPISQNNRAVLVQPNVRNYHMNQSGIAAPDVIQAMTVM